MEDVWFGGSKPPASSGDGKALRLRTNTPTHASLRRLVAGFTNDQMLQEDLLQECLLCLWRAQRDGPARTRSWYLQNCRFRIQHWLAAGRSLDSPKRSRGDHRISITDAGEAVLTQQLNDGEIFEAISCRDVIGTLAHHLEAKEQAVLRGLADGLVLQEIAVQCELSYPTALKYRRKIARLTIKLGIARARPWSTGEPKAPAE
jgi:DNA-directed RNA polymerase specialized sigma24 family protein